MADTDFDDAQAVTPASIGRIDVGLHDPDGTNANRQADGVAEVLDAAGVVIGHIRVKDLRPILTTQQQQQLAGILDALRARAESKIP